MDLKKLWEKYPLIPCQITKQPIVGFRWKSVYDNKVDFELLQSVGVYGFALGGVDGVEVIDIDNKLNNAKLLFSFIKDNYLYTLIDAIGEHFPIVKTQSGGYHIYFRSTSGTGSKKLAMAKGEDGKIETIIESRGYNAYCLCPPTKGYELIDGDLMNIPLITEGQRNDLFEICQSLNEYVSENKVKKDITFKSQTVVKEGKRLGDLYNEDSTNEQEVLTLLFNAGWQSKDNVYFTRPNKKIGVSATFGKVAPSVFYCFTSSCVEFEINTAYSMFAVYTILKYNGNYKQAALSLVDRYGSDSNIKTEKENKPVDCGGDKPKARRKVDKWEELLKILSDKKLKFRYNVVTKIFTFSEDGGEWQQLGLILGDLKEEYENVRKLGNISKDELFSMIGCTRICEMYNPFADFINSLPAWDGRDYLHEFCNYLTFENDDERDWFEVMLKKQLIRTIRCAVEEMYVNRFVFVIFGSQEIGKTYIMRWLTPHDLYYEATIDTNDKDSVMSVARYMVINLDDLDGMNRKDLGTLKSFISKQSVTKRAAYARNEEIMMRRCSFYGSTNKLDLLTDDHNSRWLMFKVQKIDYQGYINNIDKNNIWAQVYSIYKANNESGELTSEEKKIRDIKNNLEFTEVSSERELLEKYFSKPKDYESGEYMTQTEIKQLLEQVNGYSKLSEAKLNKELKRKFGNPTASTKKGGRATAGRCYYVISHIPPFESRPVIFNTYESRKETIEDLDVSAVAPF